MQQQLTSLMVRQWFIIDYFLVFAVLDIVEDILRNMDKRYFSCGVFIDLKKGF